MSKSRRKVTVDTAKSVSDESEKRKPSVFERLGPGGGQRKYEYEPEVRCYLPPYLPSSLSASPSLLMFPLSLSISYLFTSSFFDVLRGKLIFKKTLKSL